MIELHNVDCMDYMRGLADNAFDLAIVDPPYGVGRVAWTAGKRMKSPGGFVDEYSVKMAVLDMNHRSGMKQAVVHGRSSKKTIKNFGDENITPPPEYFEQLFRVSRKQIIWGGNYYVLPPSRGFVIWRKPSVTETFSMAMCEYAWLSFDCNSKIIEMASQGKKSDPRIHPTQKPVALYCWLLQMFAKKGDRILDTHLGSGSSAIACEKMGFDFVGCEIDKDYYDGAVKRLDDYRAQQIIRI